MQAKKAVQDNGKSTKRDKKAKILSIQDATCTLIQTRGYEKVTIRDIAEAAGVSIGLIYKYFPGGKFDILKEIGHQYADELLLLKQPENIDFNDFPGYMRNVIKNIQQLNKDNSSLEKALIMAALIDGEIVDEVKNMDFKDYKTAAEFFCRFNGVEIGNKDPLEVLIHWGIAIKGIILCSMIYLYNVPFMSEEALTDLMIDLSLKIWGYRETS
jgi:AcrR family transcriptional regulator